MKLCCIYWILLLISFTSSCLLFLIVASESTNENLVVKKIDDKSVTSNVTIIEKLNNDGEDNEDNFQYKIEPEISEITTEIPKNSQENGYGCSDNPNENEENLSSNIFEESLTQQPNLSQGISETGQAVVLTLVDTASAELQNLAEPHLSSSDVHLKTAKNLSITLSNSIETNTDTLVSQLPHTTSTIYLSNENINNDTDNNIKNNNLLDENIIDKSKNDDKNYITDNLNNEKNIKTTENIQIPSSIEFDDAKFINNNDDNGVGGSGVGGVGSGSVIIDGIVNQGGTDNHEDIPSFSEWAQKRLEEAEKKKNHQNASIQNTSNNLKNIANLKVRSKNYASPDCGAKIVAVNPEARSARSVLVSTRDEYMLNTCTTRVWFVVELCEAIQAKKIEIANFELFSSSPKDFSVFVSDRFTTRDWSLVGQFTAQDERDIQSFTLKPHLFGKFIKIELHSHYGSEHFCPISLFRAYGTSEFEVLETETEVQETIDIDNINDNNIDNDDDDDDDEEIFDNNGNDSSRNLFGSARDAVIRIVKKAAGVLVKNDNGDNKTFNQINNDNNINNNSRNIKQLFNNCITPKYNIICNNCTDNIFDKIYQLISCRINYLNEIINIPLVNNTLYNTDICYNYGINNTLLINNLNNTKKLLFLKAIYSNEYIISLCNLLAMKNNVLLVNLTNEKIIEKPNVTLSLLASSSSASASLPLLSLPPSVNNIDSSNKITESIITQATIDCNTEKDSLNCRQSTVASLSSSASASSASSSLSSPSSSSSSKDSNVIQSDASVADVPDVNTGLIKDSKNIENTASTIIIGTQIKPSKTLTKNDYKRESSIPNLEPSKDIVDEILQDNVLTTTLSPFASNSATANQKVIEESTIYGTQTETITQSTSQISSQNVIDNNNNNYDNTIIDLNIKSDDNNQQIKQDDKKEKLKDNDDNNINSHENLNDDTLLSDLREFENSDTLINNPSIITQQQQQQQPTASTTPQQKESVFLRLSNRIKALERNMSLSGQYLEELSKRYKKQVEEMQKTFERTTITMNDEFKKNEERDNKKIDEIIILKKQLSLLSDTIELIINEHNSWGNKLSTFGQHIVFIFIEIIILVLIITYCRKTNNNLDDIKTKTTTKNTTINNNNCHLNSKDKTRRKSTESSICNNNINNKEIKKRRPSEIASRISGNYRDLMIDTNTEMKKDKKRKKKRESLMRLGSNIETKRDNINIYLPSRRSLSVDTHNYRDKIDEQLFEKSDSAPDCEYNINDNDKNNDNVNKKFILIDEIDHSNNLIIDNLIEQFYDDSKDTNDDNDDIKNTQRGLSILKNTKLRSSSFMKTALRSRSKKNDKSSDNSNLPSSKNKLDKWESHSKSSIGSRSDHDSSSFNLNNSIDLSLINNSQNGNYNHGVSEDSECSSTTPINGKKIKKESGLRKMVRKFF